MSPVSPKRTQKGAEDYRREKELGLIRAYRDPRKLAMNTKTGKTLLASLPEAK